jgi:hypothetical protein
MGLFDTNNFGRVLVPLVNIAPNQSQVTTIRMQIWHRLKISIGTCSQKPPYNRFNLRGPFHHTNEYAKQRLPTTHKHISNVSEATHKCRYVRFRMDS